MFKKTTFPGLMAGLACAVLGTSAFCDDGALYAEPLPDDAVFVRALYPADATMPPVSFGGRTLHLTPSETGAYAAISAQALEGVAPGGFFSVLSTHDGGQIVVSEPPRDARDKVHLILINASQEPVRLVVPGHGMQVIAPVDQGDADSRPVNPVATKLAVERVRDAVVLAEFDLRLSRGQNLTFLAQDGVARMIENSFGPELKPKGQ